MICDTCIYLGTDSVEDIMWFQCDHPSVVPGDNMFGTGKILICFDDDIVNNSPEWCPLEKDAGGANFIAKK